MVFRKVLPVLAGLFLAASAAAMDGQFIFQTYVMDPSNGGPLNGTYNVRLTVYNEPTGVTELWHEDQTVTAHEGWIHVIMTTAYPFEQSERYVKVTIQQPGMKISSPEPLYPVPFSYISQKVESPSGVSTFSGSSSVQMVDGDASSDGCTGMLSIHTSGYTHIPLQLTSMSTGLISGSTSRGDGITVSTCAGTGVVGTSTGGYYIKDDPRLEYIPSTGVKGVGKNYGGYFIGGVHVEGEVTREYGTSGDKSRAVPIAYGNVDENGGLSANTPNLMAKWDAEAQCFKIIIRGYNYSDSEYVTVVTPCRTTEQVTWPNNQKKPVPLPAVFSQVYASDNTLCVELFTPDGVHAKRRFQFVTYKP